ncbi:MAG: flagellar hook-associated protein FlgL [Janthinobacterium lividum]
MQVNTRAAHDARTAQMSSLSLQLDRLQASISTEKRINTPDDDPIGAARVLQINRTLATGASQQTGVDRATSRLSSADAALSGVGALFARAKEISLLGANATLNVADRATLAAEVAQLSEQLLGYANTRDSDGGSLFGGARTAAAAYAADTTGAIAYQGAGTAAAAMFDDGAIPTSIDGPRIFAGLPGAAGPTDAFAMLQSLGSALAEPDPTKRTAALASSQTSLDAAVSRTADVRATIGTRLTRLETESTRLDASTLRLKTDLATTEGLDMSDAIAHVQRLLTVLQATQLSFAKISSLSLWDQLR